MATSLQAPKFKPGLLLTHNWSQLHTEKGLCDTTITETPGQDFHTVLFPITTFSQYQAFISGQVLCQEIIGCPLQFLGENFPSCCHDKPISAVAKVIYQVTHTLSADNDCSLSDDAKTTLKHIDRTLGQVQDEPRQAIQRFLQTYGSHFRYGRQQFGKTFSWLAYVDGECDMKLLLEIANEIFHKEPIANLPASDTGNWHSVSSLVDYESWSGEKKQILKAIKLRVCHGGSTDSQLTFLKWKSLVVKGQILRVDCVNILSLWDLIDKSREEFQYSFGLISVVKDEWSRFVAKNDLRKPKLPENLEDLKPLDTYETFQPQVLTGFKKGSFAESNHGDIAFTQLDEMNLPDTRQTSRMQEQIPNYPHNKELPDRQLTHWQQGAIQNTSTIQLSHKQASPQAGAITNNPPTTGISDTRSALQPQSSMSSIWRANEHLDITIASQQHNVRHRSVQKIQLSDTYKASEQGQLQLLGLSNPQITPQQDIILGNRQPIERSDTHVAYQQQGAIPKNPQAISYPERDITPMSLQGKELSETYTTQNAQMHNHWLHFARTLEKEKHLRRGTSLDERYTLKPQAVESGYTYTNQTQAASVQNVTPKSRPRKTKTKANKATQQPVTTHMRPDTPNHWSHFVTAFGMEKYFPCKLTLGQICKLYIGQNSDAAPSKADLPWKVLEELMFMNLQCREHAIYKFSKAVKSTEKVKTKTVFGESIFHATEPTERIPHPMDMMLLLFTCSDYMLRQVLARKLFMCRLAIPFIVPTAEGQVEMFLWPLRSIILEWRNVEEAKEEALVKCNLDMVAFLRYGEIDLSKSSLMNNVLSPHSHATFFNKECHCGSEKRLISNGTVEMSHFLPGERQQDVFNHPAVFFNLRGDACDYPAQHSVLLNLATVLVVFVDIAELCKVPVQELLGMTSKLKHKYVSFVLTNSKRHTKQTIMKLHNLFSKATASVIDDEDMVTTFTLDGGCKTLGTVIEEVRCIIATKMINTPKKSLEQFAQIASHSRISCVVDEFAKRECHEGRALADRIMQEMFKVDILQRKKMLLPKQGPVLTKLGKLLRTLYRISAKGKRSEVCINKMDELQQKEELKKQMNRIRMEQVSTSAKKTFIGKVIELLQQQKEIREFAMKFLQLELDSQSRLHLPNLQRKKSEYWEKLAQAQEKDENAESVQCLQRKIQAIEEDISEAALGWEHFMREVGQVYETASAMKNSKTDVSFLSELVGRQLLEGHPVELMDGDHGVLPLEWMKAVFQSLSKIVRKKNKIFVVSVVGIQSSGKSTLLNTMFGLEFAVSAGRCTRGIYAQLLPVKENQHLQFDYLLVLDSEGLRSQQREKNYEHDNELATLVIGLSDMALINMKGENLAEMVDVLQIVVHAFLRMKLADSPHKRQCMIIHQNVAAVNAKEKLADDRQRLAEKLNAMTKQASIAQGLSECITSFNRIIGFDSQKDVVYFSDLLNGDPPMATINQGYSHKAADTQQRILRDIQGHLRNSITIPDFVTRVEDIWKGVLTDDFIFSFRNTLAAKAYIEVERELAGQTFEIEQKILEWMTTDCKVEIGNCQEENNLHECCTRLIFEGKTLVQKLVSQKEKELQDFFENHSSSEIIVQWKSEKVASLRTFGETQYRQIELDLNSMRQRKLVELQNKNASKVHEQEILVNAIALAETIRDKDLSEHELQTQFDKLWESWTSKFAIPTSSTQGEVMTIFQDVVWSKFHSEGDTKFLQEQIEHTPLQDSVKVTFARIYEGEIKDDYISIKDPSRKFDWFKKIVRKKSDYFDEASQRANQMMETVMLKVDSICTQDAQFKKVHGREIIDLLWNEIANHNDLPFDKAAYAITTQFKALLAVCVTNCAIPKFEQMNQRFEDQYGVEAQMKRYKGRVFLLFKNSVKQVSADSIASQDFCEALKKTINEYVQDNVKRNIPAGITQDLGSIKYDLIIKILDEIAAKGSFTTFLSYATEPTEYAEKWTAQYCDNHVFATQNGQTKFSKLASLAADNIFSLILLSAQSATKAVSEVDKPEKYNKWIEEFCSRMKKTVPVDSKDLSVAIACQDTNFEIFQQILETDLKQLQKAVTIEFQMKTAQTATWLHNTYQKIFQRIWGCREFCPRCKEPCQKAEKHEDSHLCVQHKPSGIGGAHWSSTTKLSVETCNWCVASESTFKCGVIGYKCRENGKCEGNDNHAFRDYKTYLPDWDIAPDPAGEACKYWQWAMCYFQKELLQKYPNNKLEIPESWKAITKQEAVDSLRVFR